MTSACSTCVLPWHESSRCVRACVFTWKRWKLQSRVSQRHPNGLSCTQFVYTLTYTLVYFLITACLFLIYKTISLTSIYHLWHQTYRTFMFCSHFSMRYFYSLLLCNKLLIATSSIPYRLIISTWPVKPLYVLVCFFCFFFNPGAKFRHSCSTPIS